MPSSCVSVRLVVAGLALLVASAPLARAQQQGTGDDLELSVRLASESEADRAQARAEGVAMVLSLAPAVGFFGAGPKGAAVLAAVDACLEDKGTRERAPGQLSLRLAASRAEVEQAVLNAVRPEESFAREPLLLVVQAGGLTANEQRVVRAEAADALTFYRFRLVAADRAGAPLVCSVGAGKIEATPIAAGQRVLRATGISGRLFHRPTSTVLAELVVQTRQNVADLLLPGVVGEPVTIGAEEAGARERLAGQAARAAVMGLVQRLHEAPAASAATPGPDAAPATPGPDATPVAPAPLAPFPADARPEHRFQLRFVGWTEEEADAVVRAIAALDGFAGWQPLGPEGDAIVYRCVFTGSLIVRQVHAGLVAAGRDAVTETTKAGNAVTLTKRP